jgi:cell division protein FtsA
MGLFKKKSPISTLALDIGTEFIKALVVEVEEEHGLVRAATKVRQRLTDMHGGAVTDIAGVIHTAAKALEELYKNAGYLPRGAVVGIAGELVKGSTVSCTVQRKKAQTPISETELRDIIAGTQKEALQKSRKELAFESGYAEIDVQLVNSAVVSVKIDGYRVSNPIGFQGRLVEVSIYTAYAPSVHLGAIHAIVDGLDLDLLLVATEPYAVARCFGPEESNDISSIFIDVGGGTTDIAVVRNGGLEGTKMFALGGRVFTRRIASSRKLSMQEAEDLKLAYAGGSLSKSETTELSQILRGDVQVWLSGIELALEEFVASERFVDNSLLPSRIYLCGGGSLLPDLNHALSGTGWTKGLPFAKAVQVQYINPEHVHSVIDTTGSLNSPQDVTPMALANIALDLGNEPLVSTAVSRLFKGLRT